MTRDGAIPVTSHVHAGNRPDVTQFAGVLDELTSRYATLFTSGGDDDGGDGPTWAAPTVVLTHSGTLHTAQSRGKTRRHHTAVLAAMSAITHPRWVTRVMTTELTGTTPASLRLTWRIDPAARKTLETELFGKRLRVTDQDHWTEAKIRVHVVY